MITEMKKQTEKGFTLIELMIVVAIIGILAAIAIPQFASYRTKAFNSASQSDIQTLKLTEEAFYADFQNYGVSGVLAAGAGAGGAGALIIGGTTVGGTIADATALHPVANVTPSTKVSVVANTDAALATMTIEAGHTQGDRTFAMDSDSSALYWSAKTAGKPVIATGFTTTINVDDVKGATGGSAGGTAYSAL